MKHLLTGVISGVLVVALVYMLLRPGQTVRVEIPDGLSAHQTADLLAEKNIVVSSFFFRVYIKMIQADRHLKSGVYSLREHEWFPIIVDKFVNGKTDDIKIVIPEGFRASQIAERLAADGIAGAQQFESIVATKHLEGKLFPSTYHFPPGYGAEKAIAKMVETFEHELGNLYQQAYPKPSLSLDQLLTVASIVEREAVVPQERPVIAAVYLNRLKKRMRLQADPTVQYALGVWKKGMTRDDLKIDSEYNTYLHYGLPPGPICSPGIGSFKAALKPAETQALYFVADAKGGHVFSETNEEHIEARKQYKTELRKIKDKLKKQAALKQ